MAAAAGCSAVALTDHDSLDGLAAARASADRCGITLVPGCEVSCRKPPPPPGRAPIAGSVHVLVYFVEPGDGPLQEELHRLRRDRAERNVRLRRPAGRARGPGRLRGHGGRSGRRGRDRPAPFRPGPRPGRRRRRHRRRLRPVPGRRPGRLRAQGPDPARRGGRPGPGVGGRGRAGPSPEPRPRPLGPGTAGDRAGRGRPRRDRGYLRPLQHRATARPAAHGRRAAAWWPPAARTTTARSSPTCRWGRDSAISTSPTPPSRRWRRGAR